MIPLITLLDRGFRFLILALLLTAILASCGGPKTGTDENAGPGDNKGKPYVSKGDEGTVTGKIAYTGAAPEPKQFAARPERPRCTE